MTDLDTPVTRPIVEPVAAPVHGADDALHDHVRRLEDQLPTSADIKALRDQARSMFTDTVAATVSLIREYPLVATAIVSGVTAGAVYSLSQRISKIGAADRA